MTISRIKDTVRDIGLYYQGSVVYCADPLGRVKDLHAPDDIVREIVSPCVLQVNRDTGEHMRNHVAGRALVKVDGEFTSFDVLVPFARFVEAARSSIVPTGLLNVFSKGYAIYIDRTIKRQWRKGLNPNLMDISTLPQFVATEPRLADHQSTLKLGYFMYVDGPRYVTVEDACLKLLNREFLGIAISENIGLAVSPTDPLPTLDLYYRDKIVGTLETNDEGKIVDVAFEDLDAAHKKLITFELEVNAC